MSTGLVNALLRQLRPRPSGSDGELLRRFATERDEAAFEELLRRHGPLVWGVCCRTLPNRADAEDAFQATFLILAQRAHAIRKPNSLGCWLHGVAHRVARRMRGQVLRTSPDIPLAHTEAPADGPSMREFLAALDEELTKLPEKYRAPLVLCYLREQTRDEAARQLGISLSTLKRRLEAARERLRLRLSRRGVELPAVLTAAGLAGMVPSSLASATLRAATAGTAAGVVSVKVLTVTEGVVRAMWETKLRTWTAGAFMAAAAVGGSGYFIAAQPSGAGTGAPAANGKPATGEKPVAHKPVPPVSPELRKLREEKLKAAKHALEMALKLQGIAGAGGGSIDAQILGDFIYAWSRHVLETEREIDPSLASRKKSLREHLDRMKDLEKLQTEKAKRGLARLSTADAAKFYRLEAEIWLKEAEVSRPRADIGNAEDWQKMALSQLPPPVNFQPALNWQQQMMEQAQKSMATPVPGSAQPVTPPKGFRGHVTRYEGGYIIFEPGLDAGVRQRMTLKIQRLGDKGKYLGTVKVLIADPKQAVGEFKYAPGITLPDDYPKAGDELRAE